MRLPARNTLLTSPLVTQVSSGALLTAASASGSVPTTPPATRATPTQTSAVRDPPPEPSGASTEGRGAAEKLMHGATPWRKGPPPGGEGEAGAVIGGSGRPVALRTVIPPAVGDASGQDEQDEQAQAEQGRGGRRTLVPAGEGGLRSEGGQIGKSRQPGPCWQPPRHRRDRRDPRRRTSVGGAPGAAVWRVFGCRRRHPCRGGSGRDGFYGRSPRRRYFRPRLPFRRGFRPRRCRRRSPPPRRGRLPGRW